MKHRVTFCLVALVLVTTAAASVAGPILKPRKYHGPIPRSALTLGVGFLGGASNSEMYDYFDRRVPQAAKNETENNDFENAPLIELTYTYKAHPQFAVRVNAYAALLTSSWKGVIIPNIPPPDTASSEWLRPAVAADVKFVPCGHPDFFPRRIANASRPLELEWTREMLELLEVDNEIADLVCQQSV